MFSIENIKLNMSILSAWAPSIMGIDIRPVRCLILEDHKPRGDTGYSAIALDVLARSSSSSFFAWVISPLVYINSKLYAGELPHECFAKRPTW